MTFLASMSFSGCRVFCDSFHVPLCSKRLDMGKSLFLFFKEKYEGIRQLALTKSKFSVMDV